MSVLDRKLSRDLYAVKGLLIAIVAILTVGIAGFVLYLSLYFNLELSLRSYYAQSRMADFWIDIEKIPQLELQRLREIRGISDFRPRINFSVSVDLEGVERPLSGEVISLPAEPTPVINNIVIRSGGYFTNLRSEEVIVSDAFARARGIKPGDTIHLLLNNRRQELFVVGTAVSPEYVYTMSQGGIFPDANNYGIFFVKQPFAEEVFDFQGAANQVVGLLAPEVRERPQRVLDQIETVLAPYGKPTATALAKQPSNQMVVDQLEKIKIESMILPPIFMVVAISILNVLMMRIAEQQRMIVGTLKAIGVSNWTIFGHYLNFGVIIGLIGGILGVGLGYWLAGIVTEMQAQFFEFPRLINRPYPYILGVGLLLSVLFSVLGTLRGVRAVMRLKPAEAMRPKPPVVGRRTFLERGSFFWRRLDFRWQLVIRSIFRQRVRTATGLFAAMTGASLVFVTMHMMDSFQEIITFQFDKMMLSDYEISLKGEHDFSVVYEAQRLSGVDLVEPVFGVGCTFHNGLHKKKGGITGIVPTARLTVPRDAEGNPVPIPQTGVMLNRQLANMLDVSAGDQLTIVPLKGETREITIPVTRVYESLMGISAFANLEYLNHLVGEETSVTSLQLKVQPGEQARQQLFRELKQFPALQGVGSAREQKMLLEELILGPTIAVVAIMVLFAGLIFCGSVLTASLISLAERQQEIATLRVLGYTPHEVGAIFFRESFLINMLGTAIGLPLGYWLSYVIDEASSTEMLRMPFVIEPRSFWITIVTGVVFTFIAHFPVQWAVRKMDWQRALNVKE
ncbi:outer membrane-specific lipoprotein transporter subunit LolE [Symmachiella dynata]|uniref:ABC transporter permease n=1 Tax=Symmachiella dynata TaxID=2527995 RepID=UPI00118BFDB2|nr:FtsX-like permease family protein [Symmachiella dynata]QDT51262.1 outer membrane-specific lipoprotein transporter subunit LolE [Symmachiella dynata]